MARRGAAHGRQRAVDGVVSRGDGGFRDLLAGGHRRGLRSNPEWRTRYLGRDWDLARVQGTHHNMGDGIRMALDVGAQPATGPPAAPSPGTAARRSGIGGWATCSRNTYPLGIIVNIHGQRFVDEGADFRNYTYARYGRDHPPAPAGG
jgi:tricarballylate dehydrogenase